MPIASTMAIDVSAQPGSFAVSSTQTTSVAAGKRSNIRCAKTEPISVAVVPLRPGMRRRSTATRASSPTRPGSTAFAKRPTENAEKTSGNAGCGRSIDCLIAVSHANARASTERRLSPIAVITHAPADDGERVVDEVPVGPAPDDERDRDCEERNDEKSTPAPVADLTRTPRR